MLKDRWERLKGFSNYHWDPQVDDSKDVKIVTRLENTWANEIKNLEDLELVTADSFEDIEKHISNDIKLYMQNDNHIPSELFNCFFLPFIHRLRK